MRKRFEEWLRDPLAVSQHLASLDKLPESDAAALLLKDFSLYASRQVQLLRQRLASILRRNYGSKTECVDTSQLALALLSTLLSAGSREEGVCMRPVHTELTAVTGGDADDRNAAHPCSGVEFASTCMPGSKWRRIARGCDGQRFFTRRRRNHKPRAVLDCEVLPRVVHTYRTENPEPNTVFLRWEISQTLECQPAMLYVLETRREVRVRRPSASAKQVAVVDAEPDIEDEASEVYVGPGPSPAFPGCVLGASMMAHLVISRVDMGCPTYLSLRDFENRGVKLPESTVRDAYARVDQYLAPLHGLFLEELQSSDIVSADDTPLTTLDLSRPNNKFRARVWALIGDIDKVIYFVATESWKASEFVNLLPEFDGSVLQGDGYAGYPVFVSQNPWVTEAGCLDHARRKVYEAYLGRDPSAAYILERLRHIYAVEARAKIRQFNHAQLLAARRAEAKPEFDALYAYIESLGPQLTRHTYMHRAVTYFINQKRSLLAYLDDPRIPISNAHVERVLKLVAMVRKNSQLAGSFEGLTRMTRYMTLVANCKLAGIDPYHYLTDLLLRCGRGFPIGRLKELLPAVWRPETPRLGLPMRTEQTFAV